MSKDFRSSGFVLCQLVVSVLVGSGVSWHHPFVSPRKSFPSGGKHDVSRSSFLAKIASLSAVPFFPGAASAAAPITARDTASLGVIAKRALRPKPPKLLRTKLSQDFAVLLMRTSYNALDQLDCVAMDQFQRDFFIMRQSEYDSYVKALGPGMVQQGDLTDPYYFDFISFAQYETMNREISQSPPSVFEEQQPVDEGEDKPQKFVTVLVKRDPLITNDKLASEHSKIVGRSVLDKINETFDSTDAAIPKLESNSRPSPERLLKSLEQLLKIFLINGYAFGGSVTIASKDPSRTSASGTKYVITLNAPAILWGGQILYKEAMALSNDFLTKAALELIGRAGYRASTSVKFEGTNQQISISIV